MFVTVLLHLFCWMTIPSCNGDVYFHNARGSNNRLDEQNRERANGNRLFDSQNNNRGGYNVGSLYYFAGSDLSIEWTNQHSCGTKNSHCDIIIQYMCHPQLRDGTSTKTIPDRNYQCANDDCNSDLEYGMHESFDYYKSCKYRERNKNLFTADQKLKSSSAIYTRQNPNGQRRGYECPEERDYYPYWGATPWKDIAIMTNNVSRCEFLQAESQNMKARYQCVPPDGYLDALHSNKIRGNQRKLLKLNKEDCEKIEHPIGSNVTAVWKEILPWNLPIPECIEAPRSRDNHNGNGVGGFPLTFNWTIFNDVNKHCALRIRYNISTGDYPGSVNTTNNGGNRANVDIGTLVGLSEDEAVKRGYAFKNNPVVQPYGDPILGAKLQLQLAINTAQLGRTFQDRTHKFDIHKKPVEFVDSRIHNVNVRGKRGNIVQVYPAVEYDFVPNRLIASVDDVLHIQWTGSNTNPRNNDGQGLAGTDRSNILQLTPANYVEGRSMTRGEVGHWGNSYPAHLNIASLLALSQDDLMALALTSKNAHEGENSELDDSGTYFDLGPRKITGNATGVYHYMCTRNNNFSNRSQKGKIVVMASPMVTKQIGNSGGAITLPRDKNQGVWFQRGVVTKPVLVTIEEWDIEQGEGKISKAGGSINVGEEYSSKFFHVLPVAQIANGNAFTLKLKVENEAAQLYHTMDYKNWKKVSDLSIVDNIATFKSTQGGLFVARYSDSSSNTIIGVVVGVVVLAVLVIGVIVYMRKRPQTMDRLRRLNLGLRSKV